MDTAEAFFAVLARQMNSINYYACETTTKKQYAGPSFHIECLCVCLCVFFKLELRYIYPNSIYITFDA